MSLSQRLLERDTRILQLEDDQELLEDIEAHA